MGFQFRDSANRILGTIQIVEPDAWRGATHYFDNDGYHQNFYLNCAARPQVQQNNTDLQNDTYDNHHLHVYDVINDYCVNYNGKWYKPLSILELPRFSSTQHGFKAEEYYHNNDIVSNEVLSENGNKIHYGFYIAMLNFGGSKRDHIRQNIRYNINNSHFQIDRDNSVNGGGILLWRIKTRKTQDHTSGGQIIQRDRFHLNKGKVAILVV